LGPALTNLQAPGVEQFAREHQDELTLIGPGAKDNLEDAYEFVEE
jgi:hypothetical protein